MAADDFAGYAVQRRSASLQVVKNLLIAGGSRFVNQANDCHETAAHQLNYLTHQLKYYLGKTAHLRERTELAVELLHLFDEYGQHWDYCYNQRTPLRQLLEHNQYLQSFKYVVMPASSAAVLSSPLGCAI